VTCIGFGDSLRKLREHLVRCRAFAVDEAIGDPLESFTQRLKAHRDNAGGHDGGCRVCSPATATQRADTNGDAHVHGGDHHRQGTVYEGAADHHVDVVEVVLQDGDRC